MNKQVPARIRLNLRRYGALTWLLSGLLMPAHQALAQTNPWADAAHAPAPVMPPPVPRPTNPSPYTGYTPSGTLFMGGEMIGNPHQILHDIQNQALFDVQATRLTNTTDPTFGQGNLAQMETHMTQLLPTQSNELFTRLYVSPVNPYPQTPIGAFDNYTHYNEIIANTQQASYQLTVANDNNLWAFKTLAAPNSQSMNILIKELPAHQNFIANSDPMGGAVGVKVNSNGDAAALQNYLATTKPYDFSWRSAMGAWADGTARPNNLINAGMTGEIFNNEAAAVFFNWVVRSDQVQAFVKDQKEAINNESKESYSVLTWNSSSNNYELVNPTSVVSSQSKVEGEMPTLDSNQTAFFGMHHHLESSLPSEKDISQTNQIGLDQVVFGNDGVSTIIAKNPTNSWQGKKFEFEDSYIGSRGPSAANNSELSPVKHGYIATGAKYVGDENATVVSYGSTPEGKLRQLGAETDVNTNDKNDWLKQSGSFSLMLDEKGKPISDEAVKKSIDATNDYLEKNDTNYSLVSINSNTAAKSVAIYAGAVNPSIPGLGFTPGTQNTLPVGGGQNRSTSNQNTTGHTSNVGSGVSSGSRSYESGG